MLFGGVEKDRHILYYILYRHILYNDIFDPVCIDDIQLALNIRQIYPKDFVR
jgi:hypothetical protein